MHVPCRDICHRFCDAQSCVSQHFCALNVLYSDAVDLYLAGICLESERISAVFGDFHGHPQFLKIYAGLVPVLGHHQFVSGPDQFGPG
jgi:hypothetical protein